MPDLLIHYLTLCNINTNTPSSSSVATWFQLKAESKPCKKSKAPLQPGCWNNCPFISLVSWIHLSPFSLVPPPSFYFFVLFMILDVLWMDPVDFFLPPPPRVALLSKFSNLKLLRPDVALCDTSKTKLWVWMSGEWLIDRSIDDSSPLQTPPAALILPPCRGEDLATNTLLWAAARRLPNATWRLKTNVAAFSRVVGLLGGGNG